MVLPAPKQNLKFINSIHQFHKTSSVSWTTDLWPSLQFTYGILLMLHLFHSNKGK